MTRDQCSNSAKRIARQIGVATLALRMPRTSLSRDQAAKSRLWRSLEGSFGRLEPAPGSLECPDGASEKGAAAFNPHSHGGEPGGAV